MYSWARIRSVSSENRITARDGSHRRGTGSMPTSTTDSGQVRRARTTMTSGSISTSISDSTTSSKGKNQLSPVSSATQAASTSRAAGNPHPPAACRRRIREISPASASSTSPDIVSGSWLMRDQRRPGVAAQAHPADRHCASRRAGRSSRRVVPRTGD